MSLYSCIDCTSQIILGEVIDKKMLMLSYPYRWRYNILRCLDYFRAADVEFDPRMVDALDVLMGKRRRDGRWPVQARHPGVSHFDMEKIGQPSRWNTLIALRVLQHFQEKCDPIWLNQCSILEVPFLARRSSKRDSSARAHLRQVYYHCTRDSFTLNSTIFWINS